MKKKTKERLEYDRTIECTQVRGPSRELEGVVSVGIPPRPGAVGVKRWPLALQAVAGGESGGRPSRRSTDGGSESLGVKV